MSFYGFNRAGAKVLEGLRDSFWLQGMMCGLPGILRGDDDQIGPIDDSARLSAKIVKDATLKEYPGAPRGMCSTHKDEVNADLLAFIKGEKSVAA